MFIVSWWEIVKFTFQVMEQFLELLLGMRVGDKWPYTVHVPVFLLIMRKTCPGILVYRIDMSDGL